MKKIILILCLCLSADSLPGKSAAVLEELDNPDNMVIDGSAIYITQKAEVFIYDAKTFKLKKRFGKQGQGPQEIPPFFLPMNRIPLMRITPLPDKLFISAIGKILYFTRGGEFIKELKVPVQKIQNYVNLFPLGDDLLCQLTDRQKEEFFISAAVLDQNFQQKKELKRKKVGLHGGKMDLFSGSMVFEPYKDRIYVVDEGLAIDVFDKNGRLQKTIKREHEPIKFDADKRKQFDETLKFMFKSFYDQFKVMIYYPEYLPVIYNLQFSDPYLYVFTWNQQGEKQELFIFKLDGTFVEKTAVPLKMVQFIIPSPFDIADKTLFQLVDNEESEQWELHKIPIH